MLFILFQVGSDRYAIEARKVVEVLPLIRATRIAHAPRPIVGAFTYHGASVPLVDMSLLLTERPAQQRLSTRVVIVRYPTAGGERELGIIAENAVGTLVRDVSSFQDSGVSGARYLGPVASDVDGLVQWIDVEALLTQEVAGALFAAEVAS